jgi:hypothetical protein
VQDRPPACQDADAADGDRGALSPSAHHQPAARGLETDDNGSANEKLGKIAKQKPTERFKSRKGDR